MSDVPAWAQRYFDRAVAYCRRVESGEERAGQFERLMCRRFLRDLERQGTPGLPYVFDVKRGARACKFLELLPHIKGDWAKPVWVDGVMQYATIRLEDWQVCTELQIFGWIDPATGLRRFRRAYEEVARKNAKSTRMAGRLLYLLAADGEPGAHVYSAATTGDQAREVFDVSRNMALRVPEFLRRYGVTVGKNDITLADTASSAKPLNAEGSTLDGLNVHGAIIDELHAHKTRAVYDVIDSATGARSQPLISMITTAGSDRSGICYEQRDYTIKVLQGVVTDETWWGVVYTLDDGDDWRDPRNWRKANPNLGVSVLMPDMEAAFRKADATPSARANFLTKRLNIWVSSDSAWMDMDAWQRCERPGLTLADLAGLEVITALDLASKVDVAAKVHLARDVARDRYLLVPTFYLPQRAIDQARNSQYAGWVAAGWLKVTPGDVIDFDQIEDELADDLAQLRVREVPYDPWQATQMAGHMLERGAPMVEYRQTVQNMSEPMKLLEALVLQGKLEHDGNPMMTWMMSNVVCHLDAKENIYPRKERNENKIDGPVAAIMALGRWTVGAAEDTAVIGSDYELMVA